MFNRAHPWLSRHVARAIVAAACALAPVACGRGDARAASSEAVARARGDGAIQAPRTPYRVVAVPDGARITGTVEMSGDAPPDTTVLPPAQARACGDSIRLPLVEHDGRRLGDVVVWLDDIRSGKPLPLTRRFSITNVGCQLEPLVQGAVAGGTLNVRSADPLLHRTRFVVDGLGATLATIEHNDAGQVVPVERVLAEPARIAVRSELYPWMRAWIQVFDHPYFAVTARDGAYALDSVPPGRYRLVAWHPRFGTRDTVVTVGPRDTTRLALVF